MATDWRPAGDENSLDLLRWVAWAQQRAGDEWVRARDLTQPQAFILGYLSQNPGCNQRDLAVVSRTTAANVSSVLKVLERRGLVERQYEDGDARTKRVRATDAGRELVSGFAGSMSAVDESILAPLDNGQRRALQALLSKITDHLPRPQ